jgi:outer membrane protein insertion porin family
MQLSQLGYFDAEKIGINPIPNQRDGTVDIEYNVTEKPSDQIQLSGGWGGFFGFVGTLGVTFNNFSARKIFKFKEYDPLPGGDGQRFAIQFQANGRMFQMYSTIVYRTLVRWQKTSFAYCVAYHIQFKIV